VPFIGLALPALALMRAATAWRQAPGAGPRAWLVGLTLAGLAALVPLALAYGPRSANPAGVAVRFNWAVSYLLQERGPDHLLGVLLSHLSLPREAKDLINGIVAVKAHNDSGHLSYLLGRTGTTGTAVVLTLVFWQLSTLGTAYPDYLPYFNEAVPHPERVLVDSDLDWGQDLRRLELRAAQLGIAKLSIAYRGTADLKREP